MVGVTSIENGVILYIYKLPGYCRHRKAGWS
jgi:hypothetical protein